MTRHEEFKLILEARDAATEARSALVEQIHLAKAEGSDRGPLVDTYVKVNTAQMKLSKIIDTMHAKVYNW